jgi:hypothetical protein
MKEEKSDRNNEIDAKLTGKETILSIIQLVRVSLRLRNTTNQKWICHLHIEVMHFVVMLPTNHSFLYCSSSW